METKVRVRKGNPIIRTETDTLDIQRYRTLCDAVSERSEIDELRIYEDKLNIVCLGVSKTYKFPKQPTFDWVLEKLRNVNEAVQKQLIKKSMPKNLWGYVEMVEETFKQGGSAYVENGIFTIEHGAFKSTCNLSENKNFPELANHLEALAIQTKTRDAETERLLAIAAKYGIEL